MKLSSRQAGLLQMIFVLAVVGSAIMLSVALKPAATEARVTGAPRPVHVSVLQPVEDAYRPVVTVNGVVQARTTTVIIPQVSGEIIEVSASFRAGARVNKGDVLFRIDPVDYKLAIEQTLAEIEAAQSELALLEAQATAEKQVWNSAYPDRKIPDLIARVPQIEAVKARIHGGEAARAAADLALRRTVIRAPYDARVLQSQVDVGQVVGPAASVGSLFSLDSLEIAVPVSGENLALMGDAIGRPAVITRQEKGRTQLIGKVERQAAALDERTRLGTLFVSPGNADDLVIGEFVRVEITGVDELSVYRLPASSLTSEDQLWVVESGRLAPRQVERVASADSMAVIRTFDTADGVVAIPPANGRSGLLVDAQRARGLAGAGGELSVGAP